MGHHDFGHSFGHPSGGHGYQSGHHGYQSDHHGCHHGDQSARLIEGLDHGCLHDHNCGHACSLGWFLAVLGFVFLSVGIGIIVAFEGTAATPGIVLAALGFPLFIVGLIVVKYQVQ